DPGNGRHNRISLADALPSCQCNSCELSATISGNSVFICGLHVWSWLHLGLDIIPVRRRRSTIESMKSATDSVQAAASRTPAVARLSQCAQMTQEFGHIGPP